MRKGREMTVRTREHNGRRLIWVEEMEKTISLRATRLVGERKGAGLSSSERVTSHGEVDDLLLPIGLKQLDLSLNLHKNNTKRRCGQRASEQARTQANGSASSPPPRPCRHRSPHHHTCTPDPNLISTNALCNLSSTLAILTSYQPRSRPCSRRQPPPPRHAADRHDSSLRR